METYRNLGGRSGVVAFDLGTDSITIEYANGGVYLYTNSSAGAANIEQMKKLARQGSGLNTFINQQIREKYQAKIK
jgi:hypothetical protein